MSLAHQIMTKPSSAKSASTLDLARVLLDGGTQSRAELQQSVIDDYALAIADGASFPPIIVFYDGDSYWLADGFHRLHAHSALGLAEIEADVRQGTRRDAILYSVGANETHGLRRSNEDKRRAVLTLLNDAEWVKWSDREIARRCRVGHPLVAASRKSLTGISSSERTYTTKHGTVASMNTSAIGKTPNIENMDGEMASGVTQAQPTVPSGVKMFVPEGENIVDLCRRGLAMEEDGNTIEDVAETLGLATNAYRVSRQIVLLSDSQHLSRLDASIAKQALEILTTTLKWGRAWEVAEPLANRVWGEGSKYNLTSISAKRLDQFDRTFAIVMQTCVTTEEISIPYLSSDQAKNYARQIARARSALAKFADRIKEIHDEKPQA